MSSVENEIRHALKKQNADSEEKRRVVYEHAIRAAQRFEEHRSETLLKMIFQAIENIEAELAQHVPNHAEADVHTIATPAPRTGFLEQFSAFFSKKSQLSTLALFSLPLMFLAALLWLASGEGSDDKRGDTPEASDSTSSMSTVASINFPNDFQSFAQSRPPSASTPSSVKISPTAPEISDDINLISKVFYMRDRDADYLMNLEISLPSDLPKDTLLPVLNAGLMTFDHEKKTIDGNKRFLLSAHRGRISPTRLIQNDGVLTFTGIILDETQEDKLSFDPKTQYFKLFVNIRMANSTIPLKLKSLEVQRLN